MVRALGYSENPFDLKDPGRLCRGRERWIEPYDTDDAAPAPVFRTVLSGAAFTDDTAADARRSAAASGVEVADLVEALFPGRRLLGFMEDGHPADIPTDAEHVEAYEGFRSGGRTELGLVRWTVEVSGRDDVAALLAGDEPGANVDERIRGFAVLPAVAKGRGAAKDKAQVDLDALRDALFHLVGFSTLDSPPARYQPMALPDVLQHVEAVVLLHRDKHGPAVAVYSREPLPDLAPRLTELTATRPGLLVVPFAIPPMLARWDRALHELRAGWTGPGDFPVPRGVPQHDPRRGRRRWRGGEAAADELAGDGPDEAPGWDDDAPVPPIADEPPPEAEVDPDEE